MADQSSGIVLFASEVLNIIVVGIHSASLRSCKILGWMLSGPGDLLILSSLNLFY